MAEEYPTIQERAADGIAEGTMHAFNNAVCFLTKEQQLRASKKLLQYVKAFVERIERSIG